VSAIFSTDRCRCLHKGNGADDMSPVERFFPGTVSFDPDATRTLGLAFDKACALLGATPQPTAARVAIAKGVVEAAKRGERDRDRLCDAGLAAAQPYVRRAKVA
jgi:hypothetical protein